jgi:hypothetical protein
VVCNLNERTQNVFDPASVSTRRRRKIAEKEEGNEERPAESSEMDLDTTRSHIRPKQVLYTGRSPWWPINQQDLGSQQHRVVELFSLRARPPFLPPAFLLFFFFPPPPCRATCTPLHGNSPQGMYIFATRRHALRCLQFPLLRQLDSEKLRRGRFVASPSLPSFPSFCEIFGSLRPRPTNSVVVSWNLFWRLHGNARGRIR